MAYEKQNFVDGNELTAEQLNNIENGITELEASLDTIYDKAYEEGGNGVLSMASGLGYLFNKAALPEDTDIKVYCPNFLRDLDGIASSSTGLRKLTLICDDTSGTLAMPQSFNASSVEVLDISHFKHTPNSAVNCFLNSKIITIIGSFDFSSLSSTLNFFQGATSLVDVSFEPNTIGVNLAIKTATLSVDSAKSAILGLKNYSGTDSAGTCTLSLHSSVWALLDAEGDASPNGNTWRTYVTEDLCWNI